MSVRILLFSLSLFIGQFKVYGYELISSKTTVSPGCEGGVLEHTVDTFPVFSTLLATGVTASTDARAYSSSGNTREMITLRSSHSFSVYNNTNSTQDMKVNVKLSTHDGKYTNNEYTFRMKSQESMNDSTTLYLNKQYTKPGNYTVYASTTLSGSTHSSSSDSNSVTVR